MTTYNGERFLPDMLDSLRKQTRKIDELLIFDDGSTDSTVNLIENYIDEFELENWKMRQNEINLGWEKNFVQGLNQASGDVIFPCDQDDIWHTNKIDKMTAAFEDNSDIWLLVSGYHAFSENGGKMAIQQRVRTETNDLISKVVFDEKYYQILRPGCTMAFRKELLPLFMINWKPGTPHDAVLWTIAILLRKLYLYDDTFIEYRRHNSNASRKISHGYKYKVNECDRTAQINDWYSASSFYNSDFKKIIEECQVWCKYRKKLLVDKKLRYWFELFPLKKYYLTQKKYIGDLYYYLKKN